MEVPVELTTAALTGPPQKCPACAEPVNAVTDRCWSCGVFIVTVMVDGLYQHDGVYREFRVGDRVAMRNHVRRVA